MVSGSQILGDAYVNIMGETSKLEQSLARAKNLVSSAVSNIGKTLMIGIGGALATAAGTAVASVWQWSKEEQSVVDLSSSIKMLGGDVDKLVPKYEKVANAIQQNTTIADDATRSAMAYAASMGAPVDRLDDLAIAAAGLSARLGMAMRTSMMLLTRSLKSGQFALFARYGLAIDRTKSKQEQFNQVLEFANKGFEKQAAMADTISGRLTQLKNNFGDIMESLGQKIAEKFQIKEVINEFSKRMYKLRQVLDVLFSAIKPGTFGIEEIGQKFEDLVVKMMAFIRTIPEAVRIIRKEFDWRNMFDVLWEGLKGLGNVLKTIFSEAFNSLTPIMRALGTILMDEIHDRLQSIEIMGKPLVLPTAKVSPERLMEQALAQAANRWENGMYYITSAIEGMKQRTRAAANESTKEMLEGIDEAYQGHLSRYRKMFQGVSGTAPKPTAGTAPFEVGAMGNEEKTQITGIAEFWSMMQKGQQEEAAEKMVDQQKTTNMILQGIRDALLTDTKSLGPREGFSSRPWLVLSPAGI